MRWLPVRWDEKVSDLVLLNTKTYSEIVRRQYPIGFISYLGIVVLIWSATLELLPFLSIPVIVVYALAYSLFLHMGVKSELRAPGSYMLTVDNTLLAFSLTLVALAIFSYPALVIFNLSGGIGYFTLVVTTLMGLLFFNVNMKLVLLTYPDAEPDHLFGASLVPFALVCFAIYFF